MSFMATVFVEVRFLKDVPAILGPDMKTYGPFKKGDIAALPKENASIFIKMGIAERRYALPKKPTLKELMKGEVLKPYLERARVKPLVEEEDKDLERVRKKLEKIRKEIQEARRE